MFCRAPGLGAGTTVHVEPSKCSTSVSWWNEALTKYPTVHACPSGSMETANSELMLGPTLGSGNAVQRLPSKCSPSVWSTVPSPVGGRNEPTVQASLVEAAATAARLWSSVPIDALGTTLHPEPLRSTMG